MVLGWLVALVVGLFGFVPAASAVEIGGSGVHSFWGNVGANGVVGGQFNAQGPRGVAVNDPGGPDAVAFPDAQGDVYVADSGNNRIQQFDGDGKFVRAWGQDVIAAGVLTNSNGTGFEICDATTLPANTVNDCKAGTAGTATAQGGTMNRPAGIAVDQATGNVYVVDAGTTAPTGNRILVFRANGTFLRAFGQDVVSGSGGENRPAQPAVQSLTIDATAGQFRLGFQGQTTGDISYDAPASGAGSVEAALQALSSIGAGNVTVTGAAGGPYAITFTGALTNSPQPTLTTSNGTVALAGGAGTATAATTQAGSTGFEVCTLITSCKAGTTAAVSGGVINMPLPNNATRHADLAIAPPGSPNAGNVLVTDPNQSRVQEFTAEGVFVRAFGWNVTAAGPGNTGTGFETCRASTFDICQAGVSAAAASNGTGQFAAGAVNSIAEDSQGRIYTVEAAANAAVGASNFRVQRFTASGGVITPQGTFACAALCGTNSILGVAGSGSSSADHPVEVDVDSGGNVYVQKTYPPGAGTPPAVIPGAANALPFQRRVLKVDPDNGEILDTFLANAGSLTDFDHFPSNGSIGVAVSGVGLPVYVANGNPTSETGVVPRVYRVDEIGGLSVELSVSDVAAASARLEATLTPADLDQLNTRYRFEYSRAGVNDWSEFRAPAATIQSDAGVNIGNGADGGESSSCSASLGSRAAICHVFQPIDGLERNQAYEFRVVASTELNGLVYVSDHGQFETVASAPSARTGAATWSGPPASEPTVTFTGEINPQALQTTYRFDYVSREDFDESGYDNAVQAPLATRDAGHGVVDLDVTAVAGGLDPASDYHYRLVATNAEGTTVGDDRVVEVAQSSDRFVELVSDGDAKGGGVQTGNFTISDDGERAMFEAITFGDQPSAPFIRNPNISRRGGSGWSSVQVGPDPRDATRVDSFSGYGDAAVSRRLWEHHPAVGEFQWLARGLDGKLQPVSSPFASVQQVGSVGPKLSAASPDLSTVAFKLTSKGRDASQGSNGATLFAEETLSTASGNLYATTEGAGAALHLVNRGSDGNLLGGGCGADAGGSGVRTRAVSDDGATVYFSARPAAAAGSCNTALPLRVYKRDLEAETTVAVSASQCDRVSPSPCSPIDGDDHYWGASADGSKVFFMTNRQLANSDTDSIGPFGASACVSVAGEFGQGGCDLYLYDSSPPVGKPNLVQVSAGEVTDTHPTVGAGASVLGVTGISRDGSRVYFVATGKLAAGATGGVKNLYVYERGADEPDGRIGFVATLSSRVATSNADADSDLWLQSGRSGLGKQAHVLPHYDGLDDGDGHLLVFASEAPLIPSEDQDSVNDVYRYDDQSGELACLSCIGDGPVDAFVSGTHPNGSADIAQQRPIASEDGSSVAFASAEQLLDEDTNTAIDGYLWQEGEGLSLLTAPTGDSGIVVRATESDPSVGDSPALSADGQSAFYLTRATILPQDINNGGLDYYVARVGGGFPQPVEPLICAVLAGACQPPGGNSTATDTSSSSPSGGEAPAASRKTLSLAGLSAKARRRAARTGRLAVTFRASSAGRVSLTVRARLAGKATRIGGASRQLAKAGKVSVNVALSKAARRRLRAGKRLRATVVVSQPGARTRTIGVLLPGAGS